MKAIYILIAILGLCSKSYSQTEINYSFDKTGRLVSEEYGLIYLLEYKYDVEGNLISKYINGDTSSDGKNLLKDGIFNVYPNPVAKILTINSKTIDEIYKISITDLSGIIHFASETNKPSLNVDMQNYPNGLYFVKIETKLKRQIFKIVKNK